MEQYSISEKTLRKTLQTLIIQAIKTGNACVRVRNEAMKKYNLSENSDKDEIEFAIDMYMRSLHENMDYQDIIDQISGNAGVVDLWNELPQSNYYQVYNHI